MSRRRRLGWIALAGTLVVLGALSGWGMHRKGPDEAYVTAPVARGDIEETVTALGSLEPLEYVDVGAQVSGQLKRIFVDVGDSVKEGDLLAEIDPTIYESTVAADKATLQRLEAELAEKRAQVVLTRQQYQRNKRLFKAKASSEDELQRSEAAKKVAEAQVKVLEAQIRQAQSTLEGDEANLSYTKIYAPMSGTVVSMEARQGQTLNARQQTPVILRIADLDTMTVWAQVAEADVVKIRPDMSVYFNTLGEPDRRWYGKVRQILPTPEVVNNVVLYNVLFDVANPDHALKTKMSTQVFFVLAEARDVMLAPVSALQLLGSSDVGPTGSGGNPKGSDPAREAAEQNHSVRVLKDGKVESRTVAVGLANRIQAEVLSGLKPGDEVIVGVRSVDGKPGRSPGRRPGA